jgi:ribosome-associated toxin RatA of RatAB toxin-antitoxin module
MKTIQKSVLIWYSAQEMFDVVSSVERYPQFLPWCSSAEVLARRDDGIDAQIALSFAGVQQQFATRNHYTADACSGLGIELALLSGPFSNLEGLWQFTPLAQAPRACKVQLTLRYGFASVALASVVGPVFDTVAANLVDAFVTRSESLYGGEARA